MKTVQVGSKGNTVQQLQQALVDRGYALDVDGDFGQGTRHAVKDFQTQNDLDADGVVGTDTWTALGYSDAEPSADELPQLGLGTKGRTVRQLQEALVEQGYEIDVDGTSAT
jgi:peptidoglycan hydrolase-like protein with peptidoglycan-binding domain